MPEDQASAVIKNRRAFQLAFSICEGVASNIPTGISSSSSRSFGIGKQKARASGFILYYDMVCYSNLCSFGEVTTSISLRSWCELLSKDLHHHVILLPVPMSQFKRIGCCFTGNPEQPLPPPGDQSIPRVHSVSQKCLDQVKHWWDIFYDQ